MRSFACTLNEESGKEIEKQVRGRLKIEQALNKDRILMPQDTKGLVLLYGQGPVSCAGSVLGKERRQHSKDSLERSLESSID